MSPEWSQATVLLRLARPAYRAEIGCLTALGLESLKDGEGEEDGEDGS